MRLGLSIHERMIQDIEQRLETASGCFFIAFNKINAFSFNLMRNDLKEKGVSVLVAKNSLFRRAFQNLGWEDYENLLTQETAAIFVQGPDVAKACKVLVDFSKDNEALQLKGGMIKDKRITPQELISLAKLPSREVLLGLVVSGLASPLTGFLTTLNQIILKFLWVMEEIKKKKGR